MDEVWKEIPNFDDYMISNLGKVKSFKQNSDRILKPGTDNHGYYYVVLTNNNGKKVHKKIHRMLAEAFIENPDNLPNVDHLDTQRLNNDLSNLRWASHSQNCYNQNKKISKSSSKYKGVCWQKQTQKWYARLMFEGKRYHLGCYASEIEAALAYNTAALNFFKTFAKLNIIDE